MRITWVKNDTPVFASPSNAPLVGGKRFAAIAQTDRNRGAFIFDDTIQAKPHTDENELICWLFDRVHLKTGQPTHRINQTGHLDLFAQVCLIRLDRVVMSCRQEQVYFVGLVF